MPFTRPRIRPQTSLLYSYRTKICSTIGDGRYVPASKASRISAQCSCSHGRSWPVVMPSAPGAPRLASSRLNARPRLPGASICPHKLTLTFLSRLTPTAPPHARFVFLGAGIRPGLPSHPASRRRSCLRPGSIPSSSRGLSPPSGHPCRAYTRAAPLRGTAGAPATGLRAEDARPARARRHRPAPADRSRSPAGSPVSARAVFLGPQCPTRGHRVKGAPCGRVACDRLRRTPRPGDHSHGSWRLRGNGEEWASSICAHTRPLNAGQQAGARTDEPWRR